MQENEKLKKENPGMLGLPSITIGKYIISRLMNCKGEWALWIESRGGEGMETSIEKLEAVLDKFYKEKF